MALGDKIVICIGVICTLAVYSILYKENPVFRFFEHIFVGLATGYYVKVNITDVLVPSWGKALFVDRQWYWIFALLLGAMFYFIYSKKQVWIARWAMGLFIGMTAGMGLVGFVAGYFPQIEASFKPIVQHTPAGWEFHFNNFNNLIFLITLLTVTIYFFFSIEHKKPVLAGSAKTGRWLLMIAFGAIFGNTVMGRFSLLIDRMQFLMKDGLQAVLQLLHLAH
jgi:hypothetical protein